MKDKKFSILISPGIEDTDLIVKRIVRNDRAILFYKLIYVPPYENFNGIKMFQIATRYRPFEELSGSGTIVSIDLSEWKGHENEEYFKIFFKFLADYEGEGRSLQYIFTTSCFNKEEAERLHRIPMEYLGSCTVYEENLMIDKKEMIDYIRSRISCKTDVLRILGELFVKNKPSLPVMESIFLNLKSVFENKMISEDMLIQAVKKKQSKLVQLYEKDLTELLNGNRINDDAKTA